MQRGQFDHLFTNFQSRYLHLPVLIIQLPNEPLVIR